MVERVALITGGAKGIGRGIALDLAAQAVVGRHLLPHERSRGRSYSRRHHKSWRSRALDPL